ncbi:MAG: NUDIX domain-containing protein [candidate division Zixibacteria bacterium]|nr:NUDIX domain-containing protein [candidate division Zixibacteria bacterium]
MPDKSHIEIESPGINVAVVTKDANGWKFLLLRRAEKESYPGFWGFLTGGRENGESVPQIAVRELKEETGLAPQKLWATEYVFQFYEPTVDKIWILPVIVAVVSSGSKVRLSPENSEFRWLTAKDAQKKVLWKNLQKALKDIEEELKIYPAPNWVELAF